MIKNKYFTNYSCFVKCNNVNITSIIKIVKILQPFKQLSSVKETTFDKIIHRNRTIIIYITWRLFSLENI